MRIHRIASLGLICFGLVGYQVAEAQDTQTHAANLFPAETQGMVRVENLPQLLDRWQETQFGNLSQVQGMTEFWMEQRQQIRDRLGDAGWQINLSPEDIYEICSGQVAVAWIDRSANLRKPYSVGAVIDIAGNEVETEKLMKRVDEELKKKQATSESLSVDGAKVTKYVLPRKAGETTVIESYFVQNAGQLLVADDLDTIKGMLASAKSKTVQGLAATQIYQDSFSKVNSIEKDKDVEYFARPIGLAKVIRSISKKAKTRQTDILKALEIQGFDKLLSASGRLKFGGPDFDIFHDGFILARQPLPNSVQILDFPNSAGTAVPAWVSGTAASISSMAWNAKDAFWKVEGIFDEVAGQTGTFDAVIEGIQDDPLGPQIDIKNDVMPYLTSEIYSASDCVEPITPDSKRSLIAIRITDAGKLSAVLERAMKNEPHATSVEYKDHKIWKVSHQDDEDIELAVDDGFGDFGGNKSQDEEEEEDAPLLNNWAITVHKDFFMFSSHAEMLQQAIDNQIEAKPVSSLSESPEFTRARLAIDKLSAGESSCAWQVVLNDRAFQMQYELFRQDKLPQSNSMLASIMERLLNPKSEVRDQTQKVKGIDSRIPSDSPILDAKRNGCSHN